jgi:hypothetical protein
MHGKEGYNRTTFPTKKLRGLSPRSNYSDQATAAFCEISAKSLQIEWFLRGQGGGSPLP